MTPAGFPHSDICGSTPACDSPQLFAANHVLHRLLTPRHPPCALSSLTTNLLWAPGRSFASLRGVLFPRNFVGSLVIEVRRLQLRATIHSSRDTPSMNLPLPDIVVRLSSFDLAFRGRSRDRSSTNELHPTLFLEASADSEFQLTLVFDFSQDTLFASSLLFNCQRAFGSVRPLTKDRIQ